MKYSHECKIWAEKKSARALPLQLFLFTLSSFLLSFLLSHWFLLSGPHTQFNRHIELVGIDNK